MFFYLGISAAFKTSSIGLFNEEFELIEIYEASEKSFQNFAFETLLQIEKTYSMENLKGFVTNTGPGSSFTGIRLSVAFVKSMSFIKKRELYEMSSQELIDEEFLKTQEPFSEDSLRIVLLDGRQNRLFTQAFLGNGEAVDTIQDLKLEDCLYYILKNIEEKSQKIYLLGNGVNILKEYKEEFFLKEGLLVPEKLPLEPHIKFMSKKRIKEISFEEFLPRYYRKTQAEENFKV